MSADKVKIYTKFFNDMDSSGNGELTISELARGLREKCNVQRSEAEIVEMFMGADSDGDKIVTLDEFLNELVYKLPKKEAMKANLNLFFEEKDKDKSGFLEAKEVREMLISSGETDITPEYVDSLIAEADTSGDGKVSLAELNRLLEG